MVQVDGDGSASFSYQGPSASGTDDIDAALQETEDPNDPVDDDTGTAITASANKHWWEDAEEGQDPEAADAAEVLAADFDTEHVIVKVTAAAGSLDQFDVLRYDYDASDFYVTEDGSATKAQWVSVMQDIVDPDETPDNSEDALITDEYLNDDANTTFELSDEGL
ncbi:hypothetical protein ER308_15130 [Egibacter rhizosphaerae]|uniref:Uncharacterized protein n=1 Tax=Egibacter rhizosphaerae TaxID=1670831 RepID=A0A411YHM0_9ACTN|nr:hypothetical protein [Egibacter rhizosphaerae]QBI20764.1 hypothetical protein ER308_15130 [Egibacter rhizosphaerae]